MKDKFETIDTGRGSDAHKKYLKGKIKKDLKRKKILDALERMNLEEINDRAELLLKQKEEEGTTADIRLELEIIRDILTGITQSKKEV
jgi:hypothetical protein